ncbi:MAG TPA: response regulator transcription factor [Pirellulaceae bacterium]|jgi:DNA-binding NarL/FixJ family response regulator|nr:response regulator transcription factor [Pirellulaceae bacterium]
MTRVEESAVRVATFLLIEDHELYRFALKQLIEMQPGWRVVGETSEAHEALQLAVELRPTIAIVDLRLKDGDGCELIGQLHAADPAIRTLVSSVADEDLYADRCLHAGASGYVAKGESLVVLCAAIRKILAGGVYLSERMTNRVVASRAASATPFALLDSLTARERQVYSMLGAGLSVKQIAGTLHLSGKTVEYHRQTIKRKLQMDSSAALARHATAHYLLQSGHSECRDAPP